MNKVHRHLNFIFIYTHTYIHIHAHTYTHTYTRIYTYIYTHTYPYTQVMSDFSTRVMMELNLHIAQEKKREDGNYKIIENTLVNSGAMLKVMCIFIYICIYIYIYIYVCVCVYCV